MGLKPLLLTSVALAASLLEGIFVPADAAEERLLLRGGSRHPQEQNQDDNTGAASAVASQQASPASTVYVLYTGGTIGMAGKPLTPLPFDRFSGLVAEQPGFRQTSPTELVLSVEDNDGRDVEIAVVMDQTPDLIDSSSATPDDWINIASQLLGNYDRYDAMVVLHGTDTMAFSSSATSFLLGEGISKPVIFTGSQLPLSRTRNDAMRNLVSAITIAATQPQLSEVTLFFGNELLRGNRATKISASDFPAFTSPNMDPLGSTGILMERNADLRLLQLPNTPKNLSVPASAEMLQGELDQMKASLKNNTVITVILYPGIKASMVEAMLADDTLRGVVILAFGAGNAPADVELIEALKSAHDERGVVLVDATQVLMGTVDLDAYASAEGLKHAGAISGYDMTPEAAYTKLVYLSSKGYSQEETERLMHESSLGDFTPSAKATEDANWEKAQNRYGQGHLVRRLLEKKKRKEIHSHHLNENGK